MAESFLDRLTALPKGEVPFSTENTEPHYRLKEIQQKATEVIEIGGCHWLALYSEEKLGDGWMEFALFGLSFGDVGEEVVTPVFHGMGPSGALREMRHTYWGDEGYLFYAPGKTIAEAFQVLGKYFDLV